MIRITGLFTGDLQNRWIWICELMNMKKRKYAAAVLAASLFFAGCTGSEDHIIQESPAAAEETASEAQEVLPASDYSFNPHVISREYLTLYGEKTETEFYAFCDAVLAGGESFACDSEEQFHRLLGISRICLPIAPALIDSDKSYVQNGTAYPAYKYDHDEILRRAEEFKRTVTEIIQSACPYQEDDFIIAMRLLTAVANKDSFDEEGYSLENALTWMPYRAIAENHGICQEIAGEYIYYLLQKGINAVNCSGLSSDQSFAHEWVIVELGGEHYHVDPTFTIEYPDSLAFFCLNDEMREQYGDMPREGYSIADSDRIHYEMNSEKYRELWNAETYRIDPSERKIFMTLFYSGEEREFSY